MIPFQLGEDKILALLAYWLWPFLRVTGFFLALPALGAKTIPVNIRILLTVFLSALLAPIATTIPHLQMFSAQGFMVAAQQILIGAAMGLILQMAFSGLVIAGENIAMSMGLGFATMVDPENGSQVPVIGRYFVIMATLLFFTLDGHLALYRLLAESFNLMPVGSSHFDRDLFWRTINWGSQMYIGALLIALPLLTSILMVNLAFGIVTRAAPQLNIFAVGFPVTLLVGFVLMVVNWPGQADHFVEMLFQAITAAENLFR
ncbi:MAG: flagellar biosynthetic protein FliR [bacterium]